MGLKSDAFMRRGMNHAREPTLTKILKTHFFFWGDTSDPDTDLSPTPALLADIYQTPVSFYCIVTKLHFHSYLEVFGRAGQDGATLLPDGALVVFQRPQHGLLVVGVPQQHPQLPLGLPRQLVREEEAEGPGVGRHRGADEAGPLPLRLQAGVHVQIAAELWNGGKTRQMPCERLCFETGGKFRNPDVRRTTFPYFIRQLCQACELFGSETLPNGIR